MMNTERIIVLSLSFSHGRALPAHRLGLPRLLPRRAANLRLGPLRAAAAAGGDGAHAAEPREADVGGGLGAWAEHAGFRSSTDIKKDII